MYPWQLEPYLPGLETKARVASGPTLDESAQGFRSEDLPSLGARQMVGAHPQ